MIKFAMDKELTSYIEESLGRGIPEQDVILAVCERSGLAWQEAENLVFSASVYRSREIARRQFPILALLGLVSILGGIGVIIHYIVGIIQPMNEISQQGISLDNLESLGLIAWLIINVQFIGEVMLGSALIVGGIVGVTAAIKRLN